jgi:hypothetical protein
MWRLVKTLLLVNGFLLVSLAFPLLFALSWINPMGAFFTNEFKVVNASGQDLYVTPVGTRWKGVRRLLTTYLSESVRVPSPRVGRYLVKSGASLTVIFDMEHIELTELLVSGRDGEMHEYRIDRPSTDKHLARVRNTFKIGSITRLPLANPATLTALSGGVWMWRPWVLSVLPICFLMSFLFLWGKYRRLANPADRVPAESPGLATRFEDAMVRNIWARCATLAGVNTKRVFEASLLGGAIGALTGFLLWLLRFTLESAPETFLTYFAIPAIVLLFGTQEVAKMAFHTEIYKAVPWWGYASAATAFYGIAGLLAGPLIGRRKLIIWRVSLLVVAANLLAMILSFGGMAAATRDF